MIYDFPKVSDPIRQGDIFVGIPRVDFSLEEIPVLVGDQPKLFSWEELANKGEPVAALIVAKPVDAIVISQDCDNIRSPDINLCEIRDFRDVERKSKDTSSVKSWCKIVTQHARINQKWFYLPPDEKIGFTVKMGADFMVTIRVPRIDIEKLRHFRKGHLNELACGHFRERVSEFYRRYPYDEWYSLNHEEFEAYRKDYPDAAPYPWQK